MIFAFIERNARWLIPAGLLMLVLAGVLMVTQCGGSKREAKQAGAVEQREADNKETINRVEQGNEARQTIEDDFKRDDGRSAAIYAQCVRSARAPENCERFLPERPAD